jgi:hypothetical protein
VCAGATALRHILSRFSWDWFACVRFLALYLYRRDLEEKPAVTLAIFLKILWSAPNLGHRPAPWLNRKKCRPAPCQVMPSGYSLCLRGPRHNGPGTPRILSSCPHAAAQMTVQPLVGTTEHDDRGPGSNMGYTMNNPLPASASCTPKGYVLQAAWRPTSCARQNLLGWNSLRCESSTPAGSGLWARNFPGGHATADRGPIPKSGPI